jgi:3-deoxy-7-phosphoheptulonate synthase
VEKTQDLRVQRIKPLPAPRDIKAAFPATEEVNRTVVESRRAIAKILRGEDSRMIAVAGPCSIHNEGEALEYARRLAHVAAKVSDRMLVVMRAYFEKPRTTVGWKGLVYDPYMDDSCEIGVGLERAREIALGIVAMGMPIGTEALDPLTIRYLTDLLSWASVGARTTESQLHRVMASGLSMPVGFKNTTEGSVTVAIDAIEAARAKHVFLGINDQGQVSEVRTVGNPLAHVVLRGGKRGPNYDEQAVRGVLEKLRARSLPPVVMVDCSHGNSAKNPERQAIVLAELVRQRKAGVRGVVGFMLESNLEAGAQKIPTDLSQLRYGVSVTDACIGWEETEDILWDAYCQLS